MNTRSKAARTGLRRRLCLSDIAPNRSGASRSRVRTLVSAMPAGARRNLLRLLQPLARNRFITEPSRNHETTTTHPPLFYLLRPPPPRRRGRDGRATGLAQRATGVRIARHRRAVSDMQLACQAAPTRSLTAGVRTGEERRSIGTSPPESRGDARGNSRAWRQSLFARPSADGRVAALGTPRREDATWAIVGQPVANGRVGKPRWAARFPAPPT